MMLYITGQSTKETERQCPFFTQMGAWMTHKVFNNEYIKMLEIPAFIFYYNLYMGGVDIANQLCLYYNTQRMHMKTWKPLFHFLLDIVFGNSYLLSSYVPTKGQSTQHNGHKKFRRDLRNALFERSIQVQKMHTWSSSRRSTKDIIWRPTKLHTLQKLWSKPKNCSACIEANRTSQEQHKGLRKALSELSPNTTHKPHNSKEWKRP